MNGNTGTTTPGYYLEDFNDQNITDGRPTNWYRDVAANWNGNVGTLNSTTFASTLASHQEFRFANFTAEYDLKVTASQNQDPQNSAAFAFRRNTPQDGYDESGYMVYYGQGGEINLYRAPDLNLVAVQTNKDLSVWRHVKVEAFADRIKVYVDGTLFIDYYEPSPPYTTGYVAFYSLGVNAKFDNLTISSFGDQQRTYYIYSGDVPIAEYDANGNLLAEYVYANGQLVAKLNPDSTTHYYLTDHLGSPRVLYGTNWNANYYAYGEVAAQSGSDADNKYGFTGKEHDTGTGLRYYGARYYDAQIGRWLTLDPAGQDWSPYAFAGNNPLVYVDKDGKAWFIFVAAALIGGGLNAYQNRDYINNPWDAIKFFGAGAASSLVQTAMPNPVGWFLGGAITGAGNASIRGLGFGSIMNMGFVGGFSGVAGGYGGKFTSNLGLNINGSSINSPFLKGLVGGGLGGIGGGFAAGVTGTLLTGGDLNAALAAGISGAKLGLTVGAPTGAVSASIQAERSGISPWTGKPNRSSLQSEISLKVETRGPIDVDTKALYKTAEFLELIAAGKHDIVFAELNKMALTVEGQNLIFKIHATAGSLVPYASNNQAAFSTLSSLRDLASKFMRIRPK